MQNVIKHNHGSLNQIVCFQLFLKNQKHKQNSRKQLVARSRSVGQGHQITYQLAESWSVARQTRVQLMNENNKQSLTPAVTRLTDTAVWVMECMVQCNTLNNEFFNCRQHLQFQ